MEIDFLGLNSPNCKLEQENSKNQFIDAVGGAEICLSLSTSGSLNFSERKKWEFAASSCSGSSVSSLPCWKQEKTEQLPRTLLQVAPPVFLHSASASASASADGFLYDLNDAADTVSLRNTPQLPTQPSASLTMQYPHVFTQPEKLDQNKVYISGNASSGGHTPTVAMARRATLARFLEKRLHRMNQGRASHIIGRSTSSEACETKNNKRNNNLKRRS